MTLNRTEAPALKVIDKIDFVAPAKYAISDLVDLYHMKDVPNETARLDLYFDAGKCRATNGIPSFVNGLLLSGTAQSTSVEIHEKINGLGGFYESGVSMENAVITVYSLRENLPAIFETIIDAVQHLAFDSKEVEELLSDRRQRHSINLEKVRFLAQREFQKKIFASEPAYASVTELEDFNTVKRDDLIAFHEQFYLNGLSKVVVVGDFSQKEIESFMKRCEPLVIKEKQHHSSNVAHTSGQFLFEKEGAMQSAIRVGRTLFNKNDEDYLEFLVLHTILGDYFGSRLMSNIREDKGYTYGIGTALPELKETGYFLVATEVRKDVREATIQEIKFEIERLQTELVPIEELELVQNYMRGQLLKSADGPYAMTDLFLSAELQGKGLDFYNEALKRISEITPERIQFLASKYLRWEDLTIVAYG